MKKKSWQEGFTASITDAGELCRVLELPEEYEKYERIVSQFPVRITPYYFSLIDLNDPHDPIARMSIPSDEELDVSGTFDTSGERSNTAQVGVQHKYKETALILSTNVCAMYCRHCFRKRLVGLSDAELSKQVDVAAAYVKAHPEITNVLISGGDSLMNSNEIIRRYLEEFCAVPGLDFIRFGSRVPVTFPERIYEDEELLELFERYAGKKPIYLVTQFNHPREVTPESVRAVQALQECGIQVRNQTVLLRGVNDDAETLGLLLRRLTQNQIVPYYIFQCRPYAMSHPRGKIEILGEIEAGRMLFKFHQNKYPEDTSRIFTADITNESTWLDENLLAT